MNDDVLGISIGSKNTVITTYNKGVFQVVLSDTSSRTIPTVISYNDKERCFGDIAFNRNRVNFKSTIIYPNRWLGIKYNNTLKEEEAKYANVPPVKNLIDDNLGFNIGIKGQKIFHQPEVIMGSFFNKIKNIWLNQNIYSDNIVISIPDYCTVYEREAMLNSIQISGLNCYSLLNESSAISINYAFQKLKELTNIPRIVCFIDFGHSQLTIFYAEFTIKNIKVLSVSSERFCGARDMDYLIAEKISEDFLKNNGVDLLDLPKAKISLMNEINKKRKTLTVNKEGTISIDEITKGKDLVYNLTRENMEAIISPILKKFENLCQESLNKLAKLGYSINNLHSIEMVGDTLRTPCIEKLIKNIYKKDLSKTLIPDECIAKGCALFAMMNSYNNYQIQNFFIKHYNPYSIILEYPGIINGQITNAYLNVFEEGDNIPYIKKCVIKRKNSNIGNDIAIKLMYKNTKELESFQDKLIQEYVIHIPPNNFNDVELEYELNRNCIPKLIKVTILNENIKFELRKQNFGLTREFIEILQNEEINRDENDLLMKEVITFKNSLEEYIYKTRDKINLNELEGNFSQKVKEDLLKEMEEVMQWLYSNDEDLYNIHKLEEKSKKMKNLGDLFYIRLNGWDKLKQELTKMEKLLYEKLSEFATIEDEIKRGEKKGMTLEQINKINEYIQKEFNNYEAKMYEIDVSDKTKKPKITVIDVQNMVNTFSNNIERMKNGEI